jgi:hypothetical protein
MDELVKEVACLRSGYDTRDISKERKDYSYNVLREHLVKRS